MTPTKLPADPMAAAKASHLRYVTGNGPGITRRRSGKSFLYFGVEGKRLRDKAALERIRSLVIPPAWGDVWICPNENGHIQAIGRDARGRKQYRYHPHYRQIRDETKFDRMVEFGRVLPKIRAQENKDLSLPGLPKRKVLAAIVRLLDETCIRVGNEEYAKSNRTFGLTTLRNRHADVRGERLHFHFEGKSHQEHDITLRDRKLAKIVRRCQDLPGQELFQFQLDSGEPESIDSGAINEYLREIAQGDFTAKDFRTWHGTGHMAKELMALGPADTEKETKSKIAQAVMETAKHLGNRPAACRKYYIHPAVLASYSEQTLCPALDKIPFESGAMMNKLSRFELAVLRLVRSHRAGVVHAQRAA